MKDAEVTSKYNPRKLNCNIHATTLYGETHVINNSLNHTQ